MTSRAQNLLIILLSLIVCALIIVWIKYIYLGEVIIEAEAPFSAKITPFGGEFECASSPCSHKIKPGDYTINLSKIGFFEKSYELKIKFWDTTKINHTFLKRPVLSFVRKVEENEALSPELEIGKNNFDSVLFFLNGEKIAKINSFLAKQGKVDQVLFSPYATYFLYKQNDFFSLYSLINNQTIKDLKKIENVPVFWSKNEKSLYYLQKDEKEDKQFLKKYDIENDRETLLTSFVNEVDPNKIYFDPEEKFLVTVEAGDKEEKSVYLLDLTTLTKKKILTLKNLNNLKWSFDGKYALFETAAVNSLGFSVFLYDREKEISKEINIPVPLSLMEWVSSNEFIVAANSFMKEMIGDKNYDLFSELDLKLDLATNGINILNQDIILSYKIEENTWNDLTKYSQYKLAVEKIAIDKDQKKILILSKKDERIIYELEYFD